MATKALLETLGVGDYLADLEEHRNPLRTQNWRSHYDASTMSAAETETCDKEQRIWYMHQFRRDRERFSEITEKAVQDYFAIGDEGGFYRGSDEWEEICEAPYNFAERLGDWDGMQKLKVYRSGDGDGWRARLDEKFGAARR